MSRVPIVVAAFVLFGSACRSESGGASPNSGPAPADDSAAEMTITSSAFTAGGAIPKTYTCEGDDVSPPLAWSDVPEGTKSLALVVDDPDAPDPAAPQRTWVHWVVVDLPAGTAALPENVGDGLPAGARLGTNDWDKAAWGGPCPPIGRHRYFFRIYALDAELGLKAPSKAELESAMSGHVLGKGELMGTYEKASL